MKVLSTHDVFVDLPLCELHGGAVEGVVVHEPEWRLQQPLLALLLRLVETQVLLVAPVQARHQLLVGGNERKVLYDFNDILYTAKKKMSGLASTPANAQGLYNLYFFDIGWWVRVSDLEF